MMDTSEEALAAAWPPTRAEALRRLARFVPSAGRRYAAERNYDRGPDSRHNVSMLSPYVRHRTLAETEVLDAVLARHTPRDAFKFVQEIFWRTYWKGWLQAQPAAWSHYLGALGERFARLAREPELARRYADAVAGRTGIDAFDAWAKELVAIGYLHNHARMWFASTWIFTLGLPWELGADFFIRHLLDGDPASNTLSWRWVGGLHTRGKTYRATRENIRHYTDNRFDPGAALATATPSLQEPALPACVLPQTAGQPHSGEPSLLVLHEDDLGVATLDVPRESVRAVCVLLATDRRSPQGVAAGVRTFTKALASDALALAVRHFEAYDCGPIAAGDALQAATRIERIARDQAIGHIVTPFAPVGPVRETLDILQQRARATLGHYHEIQRRYDALAWPYATRGFYELGKRIPDILRDLGLAP